LAFVRHHAFSELSIEGDGSVALSVRLER